MNIKKKFTESDLKRIKDAVKVAEDKISGEIVPVIVDRSGEYGIANYKGCLLGASLGYVTMILLDRYVIDASHTLFYDPVFIFAVVILGGVLGAWIPAISDPVKRFLVTQRYQDHATRQRAENAFLEEEVFNTRQRTGILIFVSFFEHEVIVMADKGIAKEVDQKEWDSLVRSIVEQVKKGKIAEGIIAAVGRCGDILLEKKFVITPDDVNELGDDLRL